MPNKALFILHMSSVEMFEKNMQKMGENKDSFCFEGHIILSKTECVSTRNKSVPISLFDHPIMPYFAVTSHSRMAGRCCCFA